MATDLNQLANMIRDLQQDVDEIKRFSQKDKYRDNDIENQVQDLQRKMQDLEQLMEKIIKMLEAIAPGSRY